MLRAISARRSPSRAISVSAAPASANAVAAAAPMPRLAPVITACIPASTSAIASIRMLVVDPGDVAAPAGFVVLEQFLGRGAARAGDREQRVEEMRLVLAALVAAGAAVQPFAGDFEHLEREIAEGPAAVRRLQAEPRHLAPHRLALLEGPVGDQVRGGVERRAVIEQADP